MEICSALFFCKSLCLCGVYSYFSFLSFPILLVFLKVFYKNKNFRTFKLIHYASYVPISFHRNLLSLFSLKPFQVYVTLPLMLASSSQDTRIGLYLSNWHGGDRGSNWGDHANSSKYLYKFTSKQS